MTHVVSVLVHHVTCFGRVVSPYMSRCHFLISPRVVFQFVHVSFFFRSATCIFLVVTRDLYSASCHLEVLTHVKFLLGHVSCLGLSTCRVRFARVALAICTRVHFLLDHPSFSCSHACPFRTATCPKPGCKTCPLRVDVHTNHHRIMNKTALLFQEINVLIQRKYTTINKVTTK